MPTQPFEETISYLLAQICRAQRNAASDGLSELGLHVGQEMLLRRLWQECGLTQTELAEQLCVESPTVTRMLQRMERAALIERAVDSEDARVSRVHVTDKGRALQTEVEELWTQLENRVIDGFTAEEKVLLRRLLLQVQQNLAADGI